MAYSTEKIVNTYEKHLEFLNNYGKPSCEKANTAQEPFMIKQVDEDADHFKNSEVNIILEKLPNIPTELKCMYKCIGNPSIEYYFDEWILMSLNNIQERYKIMKKSNNSRIVDFSTRYCGMGHCVICAYDTKDGKIFYRRDGGSSGWDRQFNWEFISKYVPQEEKKFDFIKWKNIVLNDYKAVKSEPWLWLNKPYIVNP